MSPTGSTIGQTKTYVFAVTEQLEVIITSEIFKLSYGEHFL